MSQLPLQNADDRASTSCAGGTRTETRATCHSHHLRAQQHARRRPLFSPETFFWHSSSPCTQALTMITHTLVRAALVHAAPLSGPPTVTHAAASEPTTGQCNSRAAQPSALIPSLRCAHAGTHLLMPTSRDRTRSSTRHRTCEERLLHSVRSARRRPGSARMY